MPETPRTGPPLPLLLAGSVVAALGLLVLIGWHTHRAVLVQVLPTFSPMQYNAALGFLVSGGGLVAIAFGGRRIASGAGLLVGTLGFLTLLGYAFDVSLGIDHLLFTPWINIGAPPGRMSPIAAMDFVLTGSALLLLGRPVRHRWHTLVLGTLGSILSAVGFTALLGYVMGKAIGYAVGPYTQLVVLASVGFVVLGGGILTSAWRDATPGTRAPRWLPIPIGVGLLALTLVLWQGLNLTEADNVERATQDALADVSLQIPRIVQFRIQPLTRMARRMEEGLLPPTEDWEIDARLILEGQPGMRAIERVDPSFTVRGIVPLEGNEAAQDLYLGSEESRRSALERARAGAEVAITPTVEFAQGGEGFLAVIPLRRGQEGFLVGVVDTRQLLETALARQAPGYSIVVLEGGKEIYRRSGTDDARYESEYGRQADVTLFGAAWQVRVWPGPEVVAATRSPLPEWVLAFGTVMSLLTAAMVGLAQTSLKNEEKFRALFESSRDAIVTLDAASFLDCNPTTLALFGCASKEQFVAKHPSQLSPRRQPDGTESRAAAQAHIEAAFAKGSETFEWEFQRLAGTVLPAEVRLTSFEQEGKTVLQAVVRDLSGLLQSEEQQRRLLQILDNTTDIVGMADPTGRILYLNHAARQSLGVGEEEDLSDTVIAKFYAPHALEVLRSHIQPEARRDGLWAGELSLLSRTGREIPTSAVLINYELSGGDSEFLSIVARDISEIKRTQAALEEQQRILLRAQHIARMGFLDFNVKTNAIEWSDEVYRLYGVDSDEVTSTLELTMSLVHPDDLDRVQANLDRAVQGLDYDDIDHRVVRPDGGIIWVHAQMELIRDEDGAPTHLLGTVVDITERKRAEERSALLLTAIEQIPNEILITDVEGNIEYFNPHFIHTTGYASEEVMGQNARILKSGETPSEVYEELWNTVLSGRDWHGIFQNRKKNGDLYWDSAIISPVTNAAGVITHLVGVQEDITERKQTADAKRAAEERLGRLVSASPAVIYSARASGDFGATFLTPNVTEQVGYPASAFLEEPSFWTDNIHPEDQAKVLDELATLFEREHLTHEYRFRHRDGTYRWMRDESRLILDAAGEPAEIVGSWFDITERKRTEAESREKERVLSTLMGNLPGMAYRCLNDVDWTMEFVSDGCLALTEYRPDDLIANRSCSYADLIHPDDRDAVRDQVQAALKRHEPFQLAYRIVTAEGKERSVWEQGSGVFSPDGQVLALEGYVMDVTVLKASEERLRSSEGRFRDLVESTSDWVWEVDQNAVYTYASPKVKDLLGYEPDEILGKTPFDFMPPEEVEQIRPEFTSIVEAQAPFASLANVNVHADGRYVVLETSGVPIFDADGGYQGYRGIDRDITDRTATEEALRRSEGRTVS